MECKVWGDGWGGVSGGVVRNSGWRRKAGKVGRVN